jgi:hypothetical protein
MTALAANKERRTRNYHLARKGKGTGADSSTFYEGALCAHNNAGKIAVAADTASFKIAGVVTKRVVTGASNTVEIEFEFGHEEWFPDDGNIAAASIGLDATILDDQTASVAATTTNDIRMGRVIERETYKGQAGVWVQVGIYGTAAA